MVKIPRAGEKNLKITHLSISAIGSDWVELQIRNNYHL